jgi:hypothetical protein
MIGKLIPSFSHGLINCGIPIQWTVLPVLRTLSRFWCPGTAAVDAFTVNWDVGPTSSYSQPYSAACKAVGTLLACAMP